ncbi:MAG: nuclear transport factor 2 family protein [Acidobacteriota bacterium]
MPSNPVLQAISFEEVLRRVEAAQVELVSGRPEAFKGLWSHRDDVTLVGGLGGEIERGWSAVARRLDWVSTQFFEGSRAHQEVSRAVGQDVAYVVQRETIRFRLPGQKGKVTQVLRATMVFRREDGTWRIVHRHADALTMPTGTQ